MITYSPVSDFAVEAIDDAFVGFAQPSGGGAQPCLLSLVADGVPIAYARAARFSRTAAAQGRRRGWCGFVLPGRTLAAGLGDSVQIRCAMTDRVLHQPAFDASLFERQGQDPAQVSVIDMVALARQGESSVDMDQLVEFGRFHLNKHGMHSFLHATYQMFFGRDADNLVIDAWLNCDDPQAEVEVLLEGVIDSEEYQAKPFRLLPGPFQTQFRYDREAIDR